MRYRSCDFFGSPEEVQVDRHASRLVEGEGEPKLSTPCLPPWPHQPPPTSSPRSFPSTATSPPYPSFMAPPTILNPHNLLPRPSPPQHTHHPPDPVVGKQPTTGTHLPFHHLSFTTYFVFTLFLTMASLLTSLCLPLFSFPTFTQGPNAPSNPGLAAGCWSF